MDTISIKNNHLIELSHFLDKAPLKNRASLGRTRLLSLLDGKQKELAELNEVIAKKYCELDDEGNVKTINSDGSKEYAEIAFKSEEDGIEYTKEYVELLNEDAVINISEYQVTLKNLYEGLLDLEMELTGSDSYIYSILCETLEGLA